MSDKQHAQYKWIFYAPEPCPERLSYGAFRQQLRQQRTRPKTAMGQAIYNYVRGYFEDHVRRITTS